MSYLQYVSNGDTAILHEAIDLTWFEMHVLNSNLKNANPCQLGVTSRLHTEDNYQ